MPFDAMLVSGAVVSMFTVLAAILAWGDYQTQPEQLEATSRKR